MVHAVLGEPVEWPEEQGALDMSHKIVPLEWRDEGDEGNADSDQEGEEEEEELEYFKGCELFCSTNAMPIEDGEEEPCSRMNDDRNDEGEDRKDEVCEGGEDIDKNTKDAEGKGDLHAGEGEGATRRAADGPPTKCARTSSPMVDLKKASSGSPSSARNQEGGAKDLVGALRHADVPLGRPAAAHRGGAAAGAPKRGAPVGAPIRPDGGAQGNPAKPVQSSLSSPDALPYRSRPGGKVPVFSAEQLRFIGTFCVLQKPNAQGVRHIISEGIRKSVWDINAPEASYDKVRHAVASWFNEPKTPP